MKRLCVTLILSFILLVPAGGQTADRQITLPEPDTSGGMPLMKALKNRKSTRSFTDQKLPVQVLSNLLWAASGINRPDGHRTAPSAMNWQEIEIYCATTDGLFLYEPTDHSLSLITNDDLRSATGMQDFVASAPLNLIYVADPAKMKRGSESDRQLYNGADCGAIVQNVYLFCASEGLGCVVRGSVDRSALTKSMKLPSGQTIILAQTVGYPR